MSKSLEAFRSDKCPLEELLEAVLIDIVIVPFMRQASAFKNIAHLPTKRPEMPIQAKRISVRYQDQEAP
jgi:hypothetical protein